VESMLLSVIVFVLVIVFLPAVFTGLLSLGFYYILAKAQPVIGKLAPIVIGLFLAVLVPVISLFYTPWLRPILLVLDLAMLSLGVLTPFMLLRNRLPEQRLSKILFSGSAITVAVMLVYGFAMAFAGEGASPVSQLLMSLPLPEIGFPIISLVMAYLAAVLISTVVFGAVLAVVTAFREREVQSG